MKYEFKLLEKECSTDNWSKIGTIVVEEQHFESQKKSYEDYIKKREKKFPGSDHVLLINKLNDEGEFEEVIQ